MEGAIVKQMIFAIVIALSLAVATLLVGAYITDECDQLLFQLSQEPNISTFQGNWKSFSKIAALVTPYDLIREAESNEENYIALLKSDADPADIEAARQVLRSSIRDIRRIHNLSWELIF